jgi:hypothetical protein
MNTKMLLGGVIGGVVFFLLGWLIYGMLLAGTMEGVQCMRPHDAVLLPWIFIGNLFTGLFISYVFSRMGTVNSFASGAMTGAIMGLLVSLGFECLNYGTTTMMTEPTGIIMSSIIAAVMWAVVGGVVGWWLGRRVKVA